ncbi:hypothetical protein RchiOBHm_Chr1g0365151 [Rosa chinensis]|uniref:Uncharacterized protein n=1 Tax=Rosa chinensis TaxID=74649 RepID=A0A2P6SJX3_ROSCH|nr:hypothetical protein RchiOBHm_Chr1g0365151 [Rosa chinensis]
MTSHNLSHPPPPPPSPRTNTNKHPFQNESLLFLHLLLHLDQESSIVENLLKGIPHNSHKPKHRTRLPRLWHEPPEGYHPSPSSSSPCLPRPPHVPYSGLKKSLIFEASKKAGHPTFHPIWEPKPKFNSVCN